MPLALATTDAAGRTVYLAEAADGALVRAECALNASLWPDLAALLAWFDALPPGRAAQLEGRRIRLEEIDLDLTGTTLSDLPRTAATTRPATTEPTPERSLFV